MLRSNIKALIFDWDDTLVGTIEAKWAQHKEVALTLYNHKLLDEDLRKHWGKPLNELAKVLYAGEDYQTAINHMIAMDDQGLFPKTLFDQTLGVLEQLRAKGLLIGLVTAHLMIGFERDIKQLGVPAALFDYIQTADATKYHKPDPRVFAPTKDWLASQNVLSDQVVYVADAWNDQKAAVRAGFQFIGVPSGLVTAKEFEAAGIAVVDQLSKLLTLA